MSKRKIEDVYPLSPLQQLMLTYTLHVGASGAGFEQISCTLRGDLQSAAFRAAWERALEQNPVLRTAFVWQGVPKPCQVVVRQAELPWFEDDLCGYAPADQQRLLAEYAARDRAQGFDLTRPPLLRIALFRTGANEWRCVWSFHHLLLDGWSGGLLFGDITATYAAIVCGQPLPYVARRPYREYIAWLQQQSLADAEAFWRRALAGVAGPTTLGASVDGQPLDDPARRSGWVEHHLDADETSALLAFGRAQQLTLNTLVQGAWAILLSQRAATSDVVFGATVAGRPAELLGVESMIGMFINTLPVRVHVTPDAPAASWLRQLQEQQLTAHQYEYAPLARIQEWSDAPRGLPLFESVLIFENYPLESSGDDQASDLLVYDVDSEVQTSYPAALVIVPGAQLALRFVYDRRMFADADAVQTLRHAAVLLHWLRANAATALAEAPRPEFWPTHAAPVAAPIADGEYVAPRDALELQLVQLFEEALGTRPIGVTNNFVFHLGGQSLLAAHVTTRIAQQFNQSIPLSALFQGATVAELARMLRQAAPPAWSPLVALQPDGQQPPFFCVHPATGTALCYIDLARELGLERPFYGLQAPGLEGEREPLSRVEDLAACYVDAIRALQPHGPYTLGGHSFGGIVAFEMARQLRAQGADVARLVIFDTIAPIDLAAYFGDCVYGDADGYLAVAALLQRFFGKQLAVSEPELRALPADERWRYVQRQLQAAELLPSDAHVGALERLVRVYQANGLALRTYCPGTIDVEVVLFRSTEHHPDDDVPLPHAALPDAGWSRLSSAPVTIHAVGGNHVTMITPPHVARLAQALADVLADTTGTALNLGAAHSNRI